jgi:hypothetical protein
VQKPTQALKTVKGPGNTFELNPKWARTIPSEIKDNYGIFIQTPQQGVNFEEDSL